MITELCNQENPRTIINDHDHRSNIENDNQINSCITEPTKN